MLSCNVTGTACEKCVYVCGMAARVVSTAARLTAGWMDSERGLGRLANDIVGGHVGAVQA
jgi:hypothetical protein